MGLSSSVGLRAGFTSCSASEGLGDLGYITLSLSLQVNPFKVGLIIDDPGIIKRNVKCPPWCPPHLVTATALSSMGGGSPGSQALKRPCPLTLGIYLISIWPFLGLQGHHVTHTLSR